MAYFRGHEPSTIGGDWWADPGERILWRGVPQVDSTYRRTLIVRLGALLVLCVLVAAMPFGGSIQYRQILAGVSAVMIMIFGAIFIPSYLARLTNTHYVVTSRRGLVVVGSCPADGYVLWAPITSKKIRVRRERNALADISWGKPSGRLGQGESTGRRVLDGLGLFSRDERDELLFVRITNPQAALGAIRGARSAAGLPSDL